MCIASEAVGFPDTLKIEAKAHEGTKAAVALLGHASLRRFHFLIRLRGCIVIFRSD